MTVAQVRSSNLGYPRIGAGREWKKALEAFWAGRIDELQLLEQVKEVRLGRLRVQQEKGVDLIPLQDFTMYDHILDTAAMFGLVPKRFPYNGGPVPLSVYFAMARGTKEAPACEMTKWFNTNYHYIVPELQDAEPELTVNLPLAAYREAKDELGFEGKPVLLGPFTFVKLSKGYREEEIGALLERFTELYAQILRELKDEGVSWVQMDEPMLVTSLTDADIQRVTAVYRKLHAAAPGINIMLQTYFDSVSHYQEVISLPVQGIGLDFVHDRGLNFENLSRYGFPKDKVLGAGLIDGRNIWKSDLQAKQEQLTVLKQYVEPDRIWIQPSCSLLHVPVSTSAETKLEPVLRDALAFADEKLDELTLLAQAFHEGAGPISEQLQQHKEALDALSRSSSRNNRQVQELTAQRSSSTPSRGRPFTERRTVQQSKWRLPLLPTTTIGSFPQTSEVRQARKNWRNGTWDTEAYEAFIQDQIREWIKLQEEIGLDVLVHGEFERTDMVEFFGEKLDGFAFTSNGWVQSYGSRCVKPPVIYGDVQFVSPMTVKETIFAQSLTSKPVKGMLTGPITILNWSFVRDDISPEQVAYQIASALRQEVEALEQAGIEMIQVDEPALREGLPLKREDWQDYLDWAVRAFKVSTSSVKDATQIHTHMCYCEFHDIIDSILALDADVISIETSRSHGELIHSFEDHTYDHGIGLGVYDIHSPRVPEVDEMVQMIRRALSVLDPELFWINPDCGLKTRGKEETVAALRNMVKAAQQYREMSKTVHTS